MKKTIMMGIALLAMLGTVVAGAVGVGEDGSLDGYTEHGHRLEIRPNGPDVDWVWVYGDEGLELPECPYTWEGHKFLYYSYNSAGLGVTKLMPGDVHTVDGWEYLYCIWDETLSPTNTDASDGKVSYSTPDNTFLVVAIGAVALVAILGLALVMRR